MNSGELLDRIEEAAIDGDVTKALLLCQKLGGDADTAELRDWAKHELEGYPQEATPPEYRRVAVLLLANGVFLGGTPITGHPIPMDVLSEADRKEFGSGMLLNMPVSQIQANAAKAKVEWRPSHSARIIDAVNAGNKAPTMYDDVYFAMPGHGCAAVIVAVQSRIVGLITLLRSSLADNEDLAPSAVQAATSEVLSGSVVYVTGDHNRINVRDSGNITAANDGDTSSKPSRRVWRWLKRILEAVTGIGTVVGVLWGGSGNLTPISEIPQS